MKPIASIFRSGTMRRCGKWFERRSKQALEALLDTVWPAAENGSLVDADGARKVLLVQPNFRIGNTILATPLVLAVRARFPQARLEYLAADTTAALLAGLPIDRIHCVSRSFLYAPWRFIALFSRLRREHFDVAMDGGMGSYSGALYAFFSGARQRAGFDGRGNRFLTVRFPATRLRNAYGGSDEFARALGVSCPTRPVYQVLPAERAGAVATLEPLGLVRDGVVQPFVAAFVGGHLKKRWPPERWLELLTAVHAGGARLVVFVGPEELASGARLRSAGPAGLRLVPPQPLRAFAALLGQAALLITPDSGPMHLAVALGVPTVALLERERSWFYVPQGADDRALFRPTCADVLAALAAHPRWAAVHPA